MSSNIMMASGNDDEKVTTGRAAPEEEHTLGWKLLNPPKGPLDEHSDYNPFRRSPNVTDPAQFTRTDQERDRYTEPWFEYAYRTLRGVTIHDIDAVYDELEQAAADGAVDKAWRAAIGIASERPDLIIPKRIVDLAKPEYVAKARTVVPELVEWETAYGCYFNRRTFFGNWRCVSDYSSDITKYLEETRKLIDEEKATNGKATGQNREPSHRGTRRQRRPHDHKRQERTSEATRSDEETPEREDRREASDHREWS